MSETQSTVSLPDRIRALSSSADPDPGCVALDQAKGKLLQLIDSGQESMLPKYEQALKYVVRAQKLFVTAPKDAILSKAAKECAQEIDAWLLTEPSNNLQDRKFVLQWRMDREKALSKSKSGSAPRSRSTAASAGSGYNHAKHGDILNLITKDLLGLQSGQSISGKEIKEKLGKGVYSDSKGKEFKASTLFAIIYKAGKDAAENPDSPSILINQDRKYWLR